MLRYAAYKNINPHIKIKLNPSRLQVKEPKIQTKFLMEIKLLKKINKMVLYFCPGWDYIILNKLLLNYFAVFAPVYSTLPPPKDVTFYLGVNIWREHPNLFFEHLRFPPPKVPIAYMWTNLKKNFF